MSNKKRGYGRPPPDEAWSWFTTTMMGTITYRALSHSGRQILEFLRQEHVLQGGMENGNLGASYLQLEAWGVSKDDIRRGIEELKVTGFIRVESVGLRQAGGGSDPSRFRLTWMEAFPGKSNEKAASHEWRKVVDDLYKRNIGNVREAKAWLRKEVAHFKRGYTKRARQPVVKPLN